MFHCWGTSSHKGRPVVEIVSLKLHPSDPTFTFAGLCHYGVHPLLALTAFTGQGCEVGRVLSSINVEGGGAASAPQQGQLGRKILLSLRLLSS